MTDPTDPAPAQAPMHPDRIWIAPMCPRCGDDEFAWDDSPESLFTCDDPDCQGSRKPQEYVRLDRAAAHELAQALDDSQSLLTAMLLEKRPEAEIEEQIIQNRDALRKAGWSTGEGA